MKAILTFFEISLFLAYDWYKAKFASGGCRMFFH